MEPIVKERTMSERSIIYELQNVSKIFRNDGKDFKALNGVNLDIYEGEIFGIIGMSGAGKSTLVRTLNRLEEVSEGEVKFLGQDIGKLKPAELRNIRRSISMIFQGFNLLNQRTVLENVMLPLKIAGIGRRARRETALEMLKIVGLEEKAKNYPAQLSGGQRQRVAIARALTVNPKVLLSDEATSALDPRITEEILDLLKEINRTRGLTVIIITHEMSVVEKICDRVAIIDKGELAEVGSVKEVFTSPKSAAAKSLVLPQNVEDIENAFAEKIPEGRLLRVVFDGQAANEPFIANLVEKTGKKVNILSANIRSVGGIGYGQMVIELPAKREEQDTVTDFLKSQGLIVAGI